jgi:hypothetical protein
MGVPVTRKGMIDNIDFIARRHATARSISSHSIPGKSEFQPADVRMAGKKNPPVFNICQSAFKKESNLAFKNYPLFRIG